VVIGPLEGGLEFQCDSRNRSCFMHVTIKNCFGSDLEKCIKSSHETP